MSIKLAGFNPDNSDALRFGDLTVNPTVDGFFEGADLRVVDLLDTQAHFDQSGNFKHPWLEDGQAAEAQGPSLLDGQEFTLNGLLEYLYRRYTNGA